MRLISFKSVTKQINLPLGKFAMIDKGPFVMTNVTVESLGWKQRVVSNIWMIADATSLVSEDFNSKIYELSTVVASDQHVDYTIVEMQISHSNH